VNLGVGTAHFKAKVHNGVRHSSSLKTPTYLIRALATAIDQLHSPQLDRNALWRTPRWCS
jgi:hypothetical protein